MVLILSKVFRPRPTGKFAQQRNWSALVGALSAAGGTISFADAVAAVEAAGKAGGYEKTCNARGFVQGRVRGGHLVAA